MSSVAAPPCYVIAEAGVNHNGDMAMAHALIDAAHAARADAIKFQTFRIDAVVSPATAKAAYQSRNTGDSGSMADMLRGLDLSFEQFAELAAHAQSIGIDFLSTAFDEASARFLATLGPRHVKSPSGEITNRAMMRCYGSFGLPVILSTGMATLGEVEQAIDWLEKAGAGQITVLHCVSQYPAAPEDANLRAMDTMASAFGLPVGWSDHTLGDIVTLAAVARGATIIEKHITLDQSLPGPDHCASMDPESFRLMIERIRIVEAAMGSGRKHPVEAELEVRQVARRSLTAAEDLEAGHVLRDQDLIALRPGTGIAPADIDLVVGRTLGRSLTRGALFDWADLK